MALALRLPDDVPADPAPSLAAPRPRRLGTRARRNGRRARLGRQPGHRAAGALHAPARRRAVPLRCRARLCATGAPRARGARPCASCSARRRPPTSWSAFAVLVATLSSRALDRRLPRHARARARAARDRRRLRPPRSLGQPRDPLPGAHARRSRAASRACSRSASAPRSPRRSGSRSAGRSSGPRSAPSSRRRSSTSSTRAVERRFFPAVTEYKPTIEQLSEELTSITDPDEVALAVERTVRRWLPCERVGFRRRRSRSARRPLRHVRRTRSGR